MFNKPQTPSATPPANAPSFDGPVHTPASAPAGGKKGVSMIGSDLKLEGSITGGSEVQIDGQVAGDVRVERVLIGEGGLVDGGVFAEAVEVRGRFVSTAPLTSKATSPTNSCRSRMAPSSRAAR